jgi:ATP-dependent DNA ligase
VTTEQALRSPRRGHEAVLIAFDLLELNGSDLRDLPLLAFKRQLNKLICRATRPCSITSAA